MRIYFKKDKTEFIKFIFTKGYNPNALSLKIGQSRKYIDSALKHGTIGAKPAMNIAKVLEVDYDELFEIK